jgi:hypothetical protein
MSAFRLVSRRLELLAQERRVAQRRVAAVRPEREHDVHRIAHQRRSRH